MWAAACARDDRSAVPPDAEFLFAAGDSTFWVRSGAEGLRVRSAPILLTQVDGHFIEVFIADGGADFTDASFTSAHLFARDVTRKDSLSLFHDDRVQHEAERWNARHPGEEPIDLDSDQVPSDPRTVVSEEIEVLDVHGPWVTFNHLLDIDLENKEPHHHMGHRYVVDVRTGMRTSLQSLFGDAEAHRIIAQAKQSFKQLGDSIRAARGDRAALARESLDSFHFDSTSFGLADVARAPAVAFMIPGTGADGEALALNLPPIAATAPSWWTNVKATLPVWSADSSVVRWTRSGYEVTARPKIDTASISGNGTLALALTRKAGAALSRADSARADSSKTTRATATRRAPSEWPIATVPMPAYQLIPLDDPAVSTVVRSALARAFDASSSLDGVVHTASRSVRIRLASYRHRMSHSLRVRSGD